MADETESIAALSDIDPTNVIPGVLIAKGLIAAKRTLSFILRAPCWSIFITLFLNRRRIPLAELRDLHAEYNEHVNDGDQVLKKLHEITERAIFIQLLKKFDLKLRNDAAAFKSESRSFNATAKRSSTNAKSAEMSRELQSIENNNTTGQQQGAINDGNVHQYMRSERARKAMAELLEAIYEDSDDMSLSGSNTPSYDENNLFKDGDVAVHGSESASISTSEANDSAQGEITSMLQELDIAAMWGESS